MGWLEKLLGKPPDKDEFAAIMTDALRQAGESRTIRYEPDQFSLAIEGDATPHSLGLQNAYNEYCFADRDERAAILDRYVNLHFQVERAQVPDSFEEALPNLLPRVQERMFYEVLKIRSERDAASYISMGNHLAVGIVYDWPDFISHISDDRLARWGVTLEEAIRLATGNLAEKTEPAFTSPQPGLYVSEWKDNHDASRILLNDLLASLSVKGQHVALAPNRDMLVVTGSEDEAGLSTMLRLADAAWGQPRPMVPDPLLLTGDGWCPFSVPPGHPEQDHFLYLELKATAQEYAEQKALLDQLHEREGKDIFVATFLPTRSETDGSLRSYATWTEGVSSLLPRADFISFVRVDGQEAGVVAVAAWEHVKEVAGDLMTPLPMFPERYRVEAFPSAGQLAELQRQGAGSDGQ